MLSCSISSWSHSAVAVLHMLMCLCPSSLYRKESKSFFDTSMLPAMWLPPPPPLGGLVCIYLCSGISVRDCKGGRPLQENRYVRTELARALLRSRHDCCCRQQCSVSLPELKHIAQQCNDEGCSREWRYFPFCVRNRLDEQADAHTLLRCKGFVEVQGFHLKAIYRHLWHRRDILVF